jgi:DNA repair protein RadA/Sms
VVIDSIQTVYRQQIPSTPGSVSQIRECTMYLMHTGKSNNIPIFIVGHVTKEGAIAGPKLLEHIVDTVLYFEGEKFHSYRILRAVKNRYGSTNEIGLFEMVQDGLKEVLSPSSFFLAERPINTPGSVVMAALEGTRSLLVEIQSLVAPSNYGVARREVLGVDYNRVALILAVLERKFGFHLGDWDVFVNVAGGIKINEPAADMAIAVSIVSSFKDVAIDEKTVLIGEVGLAGEVRAVNQIEKRLEESSKLGFTRCILPKPNLPSPNLKLPLKLEGVKHLKDALLHLDLI